MNKEKEEKSTHFIKQDKKIETKTELTSFFCCSLLHFLFIPHNLCRLEVPGAPCRLVL